MQRGSWQLVSVALWALVACGDEAKCGDVVCNGPAGLPCRCGTTSGGAAGSSQPVDASTPGQSAALQLTGADQDRVVELKVGQDVELTLQTIGPGEYADPELSSAAVRFDGKSYAPLPNPGGPRQIYRFHALTVGSVTVAIPHTQGRPSFGVTFHVT